MYIEVDDGVFVNLTHVFTIRYKSYQSKGLWIFSSSHVEESDRSLADKSNRKVNSRFFSSREEADAWLEEILKGEGVSKLDRRVRRRQQTDRNIYQ